MTGLPSVSVDNAGIELGVEMAGTEFAAGRIEPGVEHTDAATELGAADIGMGETEAECVERTEIVVDMGFAPGSAAAISATSVAPGAASVGAQVAAVPSFVDAASAVRSFAAPNALAFPAAVAALLASAVPGPSAARFAAVQRVVSPTAGAEFAFAAPASADAEIVAAVAESAAAVADAFAGATAVAIGAALVAVGSSRT
jgi:hypothetical protein